PGPEPRIGALGVKVFRSRIACLPGSSSLFGSGPFPSG
ncbi:KIAA1755 isoform 7, partial [Pongo abelii]